MAKKEKESYEELHGIFGNAVDYHVYHMTKADYFLAYLLGILIGGVVTYAFFRGILFILIGAVVCAWNAPKLYNDYKRKQRQKQLLMQFKDLLESLTASYSAGQNTLGAFTDALGDMSSIYGEESDIVQEIQLICAGISNNINIEVLLLDFANRSGLDDVMSFANVFEICSRQGGDMKKIVADTREIINDKIEIEMEIETMISGNKNELNVMMIMPVVVVLSLSSLGTMTIVSNSLMNVVVKIVCISIFAIAYMIGKKVVDIKI